jgi:hypothetical protein
MMKDDKAIDTSTIIATTVLADRGLQPQLAYEV